VNIPSYRVKVGDVVQVREKSKNLQRFKDIVDVTAARAVPEWLTNDAAQQRGVVTALPTREQIATDVHEMLIVELYSK
jgi:small subunit ribosomal protein S4